MSANGHSHEKAIEALPPALRSRNPFAWLTIFGPGAVIASLTIGAGELIFSARGGAVFGYRLLWFFFLVLLLKWGLVFGTARHIVLTGAHPFQRWMELPGPRGWLPMVFGLLAIACFPVWVGFHSGTLGALLSWLVGTEQSWRGGAYFLWAIVVLGGVMVLVVKGGYTTLERGQLVIVLLMLLCVLISLFLLRPDWFAILKGLLIPQPLEYPPWISEHKEIAARPVWVESITYVGVIGGSGYDYLAYVTYLRAKHWGGAGRAVANAAELEEMCQNPSHVNRRWLRALWMDSVCSFLAVLVFSAVFVACGAMILGPQHKVPSGNNLLRLQAEFVTPIYPWLKPMYFVGAFLSIFGTLYGTIEVAPPVLREIIEAFQPGQAQKKERQLRWWAVWWVGLGGLLVIVASFVYHLLSGAETPPGLVALLTPANLFTGVLACGFICLLSLWMDWRFLPPPLRMARPLQGLNLLAGIIFLLLGLKGYWDHSRWRALIILAATLAGGWIGAWLIFHFNNPHVFNPEGEPPSPSALRRGSRHGPR